MVLETGTQTVKSGLAEMLKGGVIMDVVTAPQAIIAQEAGACAVMALERVPSDIRKHGGVARMSDPTKIREIIGAVTIPVMAKVRIGHFVEASILQALGVDYVDESEVLTPADEKLHIDKWAFAVPFVCGCRDLGEALRRLAEGAAMIRTKGEAGTGNIVEAVRHMRAVQGAIRALAGMADEELVNYAKEIGAPRGTGARDQAPATAAGRQLRGRRHRDARRRGADDAPGRRRRLRRQRHLQVRAAAAHGRRHRPRHHPLQRRPDPGRGLDRPGRRHARPQPGRHPAQRAPRLARLVRRALPPTIGVLALQGDFHEHAVSLRALGAAVREIRKPEQLQGLDGLIIPGGESTTIARLLLAYDLHAPLRRRGAAGLPIWGTCAGAILLADDVPGLDRPPLGLLPMTVERNAYGRQIDSFETDLDAPAPAPHGGGDAPALPGDLHPRAAHPRAARRRAGADDLRGGARRGALSLAPGDHLPPRADARPSLAPVLPGDPG